MPNEQEQKSTQQVDNQDEVFTEPQDLSQAFETLREVKQMPAEAPVEPAAGQQSEPQPEPEQPVQQQPAGYDGGYQQQEAPVYDGTGAGFDGYADSSTSVDYSAFARGMVEEITKAAAQQATEYFKEQGIEKFNVNMLYKRDEDGTVTFENPDNPRQPFASRQEAQAWCDAINSDIDNEWRRTATEKRNEILGQAMPAMRLLQFAPTFNAMSKNEQDIFDTLIEPYAVTNDYGQTIGYNCDLDAFAGQARKIAARYGSTQQAQQVATQQPAPPSGPAVDMRASGSQSQPQAEVTDPKDLTEAMKMLKQK